jgi:hypothetical protein
MLETHKSATSLAMISFLDYFLDLLSMSVIYGEAASHSDSTLCWASGKPRDDQK